MKTKPESMEAGGVCFTSGVRVVEVGEQASKSFRLIYLDTEGCGISPWNHIPLNNIHGDFHVVCTTPRGKHTRMEISWDELWAPLKYTVSKRDQVASYSVPPKWNLGILPQTMTDDPGFDALNDGLPADCNALEVIEIGSKTRDLGEVYSVKPISAFAVLQRNTMKLSWKVIAVAADDDLAFDLNDVGDVAELLPGLLDAVREWLRGGCSYDLDMLEKNVFGHNERPQDFEKTMRVIDAAHSCFLAQKASSPPLERFPFSMSPYEPVCWARKFGLRSFPKPSSAPVPFGYSQGQKLRQLKSMPPLYIDTKSAGEQSEDASYVTHISTSGKVIGKVQQRESIPIVIKPKGPHQPGWRIVPARGALTRKSPKARSPVGVGTPRSRSSTPRLNGKASMKRVTWSEVVEIWEIPRDVIVCDDVDVVRYLAPMRTTVVVQRRLPKEPAVKYGYPLHTVTVVPMQSPRMQSPRMPSPRMQSPRMQSPRIHSPHLGPKGEMLWNLTKCVSVGGMY